MRTAVLAAALAFRTPVTLASAPVPRIGRKLGRMVMSWLDLRRARIDGAVQ